MRLLFRCSLLLSLAAPAAAAGLDEPYVGGIFGSPAATNPSAVWWNPAGLAAARGTRFLVDIGPSFSRLSIDRGALPRGGVESFTDTAVVPFVGLASDFGVRRIGVGFALFVPQAQRWRSDLDGGPNRYHLRTTTVRVLQLALAGSYEIGRVFSFGVSASVLEPTSPKDQSKVRGRPFGSKLWLPWNWMVSGDFPDVRNRLIGFRVMCSSPILDR